MPQEPEKIQLPAEKQWLDCGSRGILATIIMNTGYRNALSFWNLRPAEVPAQSSTIHPARMKANLIFASLALTVLATRPCSSLAGAPQPPADNLKVWLAADTGVTTNVDGSIALWTDQAPALVAGGADHNGNPSGTDVPMLSVASYFPSGAHPVITLDGATGFVLDNVLDATTPTVSAYVVATVTDPAGGGALLANSRSPYGLILGLSQNANLIGAADWYTGAPANDLLSAPLANGTPLLVEATFDSVTEVKTLYTNGVKAATGSGLALTYATWAALCIGAYGTFPNVNAPLDTNVADVTLSGDFFTGDIAEVLFYDSESTAQRLAVEAYFYQKYFFTPTGAAAIAKPPVNQTVNESQPVTFAVGANGAPPLSYQWFTNGAAVPGATAPWYTLNSVSRSNAGQFTIVVSNALGTATSSVALTVIPDTTPPTLVSADRDYVSSTTVSVVFSKAVSAATATATANYAINSGVTVSSAVIGATPDTVVLTTSPITFGPAYVLTVHGVSDQDGNVIAAGSHHALAVVNLNAPIPTTALKLWLRADLGVTTNASGAATAWADQQVGTPPKNGTSTGSPLLVQDNTFANGLHSVMQFDGASAGFNLANGSDMLLTNMTIYAVWSIPQDGQMETLFSNYRDVAGWCVGISDDTQDLVKWFTAPPNQLEDTAAPMTPGQYYMTTCAYSSAGGLKSLFMGTNLLASESGIPLTYASGVSLTVGFLGNGGQHCNCNLAELIAYDAVSPSQEALVWNYLNQKYFEVGTGKPVITGQPQSVTVNEFDPAAFDVLFLGAPPVSFQWLDNGTAIPGANQATYQIPSVSRTQQGDAFSVQLSNTFGIVTSSNAILTVILQTNPPALVSAFRDYLNAGQATVVFSKTVAGATALIPGNYAINNGVTIQQAVFGLNSNTVVLTTSPLALGPSYTLTVNGVQDVAGNVIATNSQAAVSMPVSSALPPSSGLVVWLAADAGVLTSDGHSVTNWMDQSGWVTDHNGLPATTTPPQLALAANFPNGLPTPVIRFDGSASGLLCDNPTDLELQALSLYVVASVDNTALSKTILANYRDVVGWVFGMSDSTAAQVKWFTAGDSLEPGGGSLLADNTPSLLAATLAADGTKTLYVNTTNAGSDTITMPVPYGGESLTVGYLSNGAQHMLGDIAEILVYDSVDSAQLTAVETYLRKRYFTAPAVATRPALQIKTQAKAVVISWPASATGFSLEMTPQLGAAAAWSAVTNSIVPSGGQNTVTIPIGKGDVFYRLMQ
jgi:hypothetical protein